jgi:hypothetical protein
MCQNIFTLWYLSQCELADTTAAISTTIITATIAGAATNG